MGCFPNTKARTLKEFYEKENKETEATSIMTNNIKNTIKDKQDVKIGPGMFLQVKYTDPYEKYTPLKILGEGAFGKVFHVKHKENNIEYAMKVINKDLNEEVYKSKNCVDKNLDPEEQLMKEINILKNLDHPNIIKIYEFYNSKQKFYLVTELCTGGELFERITTIKKLSEKIAYNIMRQLLSAVYYCHNNNVIHRDLKPENILIENSTDKNKEDFSIKVIDFGTSEIFLNRSKLLKEKIGTVYYMAPEVFSGQYDEKCDLWSCGIILYIILCGEPPFTAPTDTEAISIIRTQKVFFSQSAWDDVSEDAKDLIRCLLNKDKDDRPSAETALQHKWFKNDYLKHPTILKTKTKFFKNNLYHKDIENNSYSHGSQADVIKNGENKSKTDLGFKLLKPLQLKEIETINKKQVIEKLKSFRAECKLHQAALAFIVHNFSRKEDYSHLKKVFESLDTNHDGRLSEKELLTGLSQVMTSTEAVLHVDKIMKVVDVDNNGYIGFEEFLAASLSNEVLLSEENLKNSFNLFDRDGDGKISFQDLKYVLGDYNKGASDTIWKKIIKDCDLNNDGEVSFNEYRNMMYNASFESEKTLISDTKNNNKTPKAQMD